MQASSLDADWLVVRQHQITKSLQRALSSFEGTHGYPPGDNEIILANAASRSAASRCNEHPAAAPSLIAFYDTISEAALPDIDNGHFIHSPDHVLNDLAEYGAVHVADNAVGIVFGSDGGGNLLAVDPSGAIHRSTTAFGFDAFEPIAPSFVGFLEQLQQTVADFADTGVPPEYRCRALGQPVPSHSQVFGQFQYPTSPLRVLPHVGKSAAEATAKLVPLQRKTEAEKATRRKPKK
nr:SMI1/KNR4 family protein [Streptomyces albidoflavus]